MLQAAALVEWLPPPVAAGTTLQCEDWSPLEGGGRGWRTVDAQLKRSHVCGVNESAFAASTA